MTPPSTGLRAAVERRSAPLLVLLSQQPKLLIPVVSLVLLVGGLALPLPYGAVCLALLLLLVGWLSYLSWPAVVGPARMVRLVTVGLLVFALVRRLVG
jgi:hypothetical protein